VSRKERENYELKYWIGAGLAKGLQYSNHEHRDRLNIFNKMYKLPINPDIALELGPGPFGGMARVFIAKKWILLDPLNDEYQKLVDQKSEYEYISGYCESMPIEDGRVDIIFSCNSLDHADDYIKCIKESFRVLKEGGLFCISADCRIPVQLNVGHIHAFTPDEIEQCFLDEKFRIINRKDSYNDGSRKGYRNYIAILVK